MKNTTKNKKRLFGTKIINMWFQTDLASIQKGSPLQKLSKIHTSYFIFLNIQIQCPIITYNIIVQLMGITDSKSNNQFAELLKQYRVIKTIPEKNITYLEDINDEGRDCLCREVSVNDKDTYQHFIKEIEEKKKILDNTHVVKLSEYQTGEKKQFCGSYLKIYLLFEYPHRTLNQEIMERSTQKTKFQEKELWSIIASCILGMSHLQKNNIKHQCISSESILVDPSGVIKVADPYCTLEATNYQKLMLKAKPSHIYLSPQLCKCLDEAEPAPGPDINPYKSDVFTLGMVIMEAALLKYLDDCYREENTKINWDTIRYHLDQIGQTYSLDMKQMIERLVSDTPKRPDWLSLKQHMKDENQQNQPKNQHPNSQIPQTIQHSIPHPTAYKDHVHLGGITYHSQLPISQKSPKQSGYTQYVGSKTYVPLNQQVVHTGLPISTQIYDEIVPIKPCNINLIRPALGTRPADSYITHTKIDENLIEVSDDEDELQTNESDPSQNRVYNQSHQTSYQNSPPVGSTYNRGNVAPQFDSVYRQQPSAYNNHLGRAYPPHTISSVPNIATSTGRHIPSPASNDFSYQPISVNPRYQSGLHQGGLPHHGNAFTRPSGSLPNVAFNGSVPITYKVSDNNNLFTDYQKLGIKKNDHSYVTSNSQSNSQSNQYIRGDESVKRPPSQYVQTKKTVLPPQNPAHQVQRVVETFSQGSRYEGQKVNQMRHGRGKFYYQDGGLYDGQWRENKMCGKGKLFYQSGKIAYDGDWENDQFTGYSTLYNQNPQPLNEPYNYQNFDNMQQVWTKFQGHFADDMKQGYGKLYFSNGQFFEGQFEADVINGKGVFHTMNGEQIKGIWKDNHLVSKLK